MKVFVACILSMAFTIAWAHTITGKVVGITDGDTVRVLDAQHTLHKVRLTGIDAPESKQAFGTRSKQNLSHLIFGRAITVEYEHRDRYGRVLGKILLDGADVNIKQVEAGLAWHYKQYAKEQSVEDRRSYATAEDRARADHLGLWRDPSPVPPWDFRRKRTAAHDHAPSN